jgi:hypothetical protein
METLKMTLLLQVPTINSNNNRFLPYLNMTLILKDMANSLNQLHLLPTAIHKEILEFPQTKVRVKIIGGRIKMLFKNLKVIRVLNQVTTVQHQPHNNNLPRDPKAIKLLQIHTTLLPLNSNNLINQDHSNPNNNNNNNIDQTNHNHNHLDHHIKHLNQDQDGQVQARNNQQLQLLKVILICLHPPTLLLNLEMISLHHL